MGGCMSVSLACDQINKYPVLNLDEKLDLLRAVLLDLQIKRDNTVRRVVREEAKGRQRLADVEEWLRMVELVVQKASQVLDVAHYKADRLCLLGHCSASLVSSYKYVREVYSVVKELKRLSQVVFEVLTETHINTWVWPPNLVGQQRTQLYTRVLPPGLVGQESMLEKTRQLLMDDGVGILGLYGKRGIGKTALLSRLYNEISAEEVSSYFDILIWIVVSSSVQIHMIQEQIAKQLDLYNEEWGLKSESENAVSIINNLQRKRFLVVLDGLWKPLDCWKIGIPFPNRENGSKIVITSRSSEVCDDMRADAFIEVRPLDKDEAWDLFRNKVGETTLNSHPEIYRLARIIAYKCCGLPLALQVIGAFMASQTSVQAWSHAFRGLTRYRDQEDNLLFVFKSIYDALEGEQVKLCLLFCALFPEDHYIRKEDLVDLWIGEGIIDENEGPDKANGRGYEIIGILLAASFLTEAGESRDKVVMHGLLWKLGLYIASQDHPDEGKEESVLQGYTQVGRFSNIKNWRDVSRVSLEGDEIKKISDHCPKLRTLRLRDTKLENISTEFFSRLPALLVLDLSSNTHLSILPDAISELVSLRYLNLSSTGVKRLPPGLSKLKKLMYLNLEHTHMLTDITGISGLGSIQVLRLCDSGFHASCSIVEELQLLEHLQLLTITLEDEDVVKQFLKSPRLVRCTQGFYLKYCVLMPPLLITSLSTSLRYLDVQDSYISEMKIGGSEPMITVNTSPSDTFFRNLNAVRLYGCSGLRELTWLLFAPSLTTLRVAQSKDIEEIISKEKVTDPNIVPFQKLEFLALEGLDKLRSVYWGSLPFTDLREIRVRSCPGLTRLPLDPNIAMGHVLVINSDKEFMHSIEWEEDAETMQRFSRN